MDETLLQVQNLQTAFRTEQGFFTCIEDVSFTIAAGQNIAIVGESGCGKSVTSLSIMRLLGRNGRITAGQIRLGETDLVKASEKEMEKIRGNRISMIFQEPMTSLNPVLKIGFQLTEALKLHTAGGRGENYKKAAKLLDEVGIPNPARVLNGYAHELSGGMRQRVMIAMALACGPRLLIADEPTTALDVTVQAQILDLLKKMHEEIGTSILLISHDLGVVAEIADKVVVMYAGQVVEQADVFELFDHPLHPYTRGLLASIPHVDRPLGARLTSIPGTVPTGYDKTVGCRFADRCRKVSAVCRQSCPALTQTMADHFVRCYHPADGEGKSDGK